MHCHVVHLKSYALLLQCCIQNKRRLIHTHPSTLLNNTLASMYSKCGSLEDAAKVFQKMPTRERDTCSWTVIISAYSRHGFPHQALNLFYQMHLSTCQPNHFTFSSLVAACSKMENLKLGMEIHAKIITSGFHEHVFVQSALVDMYAKCGILDNARHMFDKIPQRDVVSGTAMIAGYAHNGQVDEALQLFYQMPERNEVSWSTMISGYLQNGCTSEALALFKEMLVAGMIPHSQAFACVLSACVRLKDLEHGMQIHKEVIKTGLHSHVLVTNALVDMYAKLGSIEDARKMFDKMFKRDVVSWTSMVAGYVHNGMGEEALKLFQEMSFSGVKPSSETFASVLPACASLTALNQGREIHEKTIECGFESEIFVESALVDMYSKCGRLDKARNLFDRMNQRDVVSWTTMIAGYSQNECLEEAMKIFQQMELSDVQPNSISFASLLSACASVAALDQAMEIHENIIRRGLQDDVFVINALIDMYAKCGRITRSHKLFDHMLKPDVVSWTVMISAYARNGLGDEAVKTFTEMQLAGMKPNAKTFASVLPAYSNLAALESGMEVHGKINRSGFQTDVFVANALIDMYAKCGSVEKARYLFDNLHKHNLVSWNTMISGYAMHGYGKEALKLYEEMQNSDTAPDHVTSLCVLSACCHAGLVEEGRKLFNCMSESSHVTLSIDHYSCMVDLLGRAGRLEEAQEFIKTMPINPDVNIWRCLLGACRKYNNIELGEYVAECLFRLDTMNATN
ncbi:pentatricopeptide repeat-containing protein At4g39530 [Cryptomeria japonica]|uniref:pentatricopeptide repeat-containing protein At4g39530 n=1 Tax=Cryptomeria japonica TaxID=3369 RepID=UPI0027DA7362|nr:pentatricopeptide repeat-containing protein At4g39530 [Cryptomeria japonica]